jgi:hypothetical protein
VTRTRSQPALLALGLAVAALAGCAPGPRSTTLSVDDIEHTASEMTHKLSRSAWLTGRDAGAPPAVVAIQKVENLSSDVIPEPDRWYLMVKLRTSRPIEAFRRLHNITFVVPAEHLRGAGLEEDAGGGAGRQPTHEMTATFRSATRSAGRDRTDVYLCECRVTDLSSGEVVWTDVVEFKKRAVGRAYD